MTDLAQFPEAVRAKIEDLDRRIEGLTSEREDHQASLSRIQTALSHVMDLRQTTIETAEAFMISPILTFDQKVAILGADGLLPPPEQRRHRRDIRDEVLAYFVARNGSAPATADMCAMTIDCQRKSVEQALMYHERAGRVREIRDGFWSISVVIEDDRSQIVEAEDDA